MKVNVTRIFNVKIKEIISLENGKITYTFHTLFDFITNYKKFLGKTFFIQGHINEKNVSFYGKYLGGRKFRVVENPEIKIYNANVIYILVSNRFIFSFKSDDEVNEMIKNAQYTPVVSKFPLIKVKDIITGPDIIGIFQSDTIKKYDNTKLILEFDGIPHIFRLVSSFEDEGNNK